MSACQSASLSVAIGSHKQQRQQQHTFSFSSSSIAMIVQPPYPWRSIWVLTFPILSGNELWWLPPLLFSLLFNGSGNNADGAFRVLLQHQFAVAMICCIFSLSSNAEGSSVLHSWWWWVTSMMMLVWCKIESHKFDTNTNTCTHSWRSCSDMRIEDIWVRQIDTVQEQQENS